MNNLKIVAAADDERAEKLALHLGVKLVTDAGVPDGLYLKYDESGLSLCDGPLVMQADFSKQLHRFTPNNLGGEMLVKAARTKGVEMPTAVDATAGLGEDSILLAAAGFKVMLFEYDPVIAALLRDALERAAVLPELSSVVDRMQLIEGNSIEQMPLLDFTPDVIVLDPMFPERRKSALIKKKFQLLQQLESPCDNENELFCSAVVAAPRKLVIKRPAKGPYLADKKPDYSLNGKAVRYDCFVQPYNKFGKAD